MKVPENIHVLQVLVAGLRWSVPVVPAGAEPEGTIIGAIRWEGRHGDGDVVQAEPDPTPFSRQKPLMNAVTASPGELAHHVCEAVRRAGSHRGLNPANAVIISGWNEHDEVDWLQPTLRADGAADESRVLSPGKAVRASPSPSDEKKSPNAVKS